MASNIKVHGRKAVFYIRELKLSGDANRVALTFGVDAAEDTTFEQGSKDFLEGDYGWTSSMDGYWNAGSSRIDNAIYDIIGKGTQVVSIFPNGTTIANVGYEGKGILSSFTPEATVGGAVSFSAELQGSDHLFRSNILHSGLLTVTGTSTAQNIGTAGAVRGIVGVFRTNKGIGGTDSHGTMDAAIWASDAEGGTYGKIFSFTQVTTPGATATPTMEYRAIATAQVGPWFRAVYSMTIGDQFRTTISCSTEV